MFRVKAFAPNGADPVRWGVKRLTCPLATGQGQLTQTLSPDSYIPNSDCETLLSFIIYSESVPYVDLRHSFHSWVGGFLFGVLEFVRILPNPTLYRIRPNPEFLSARSKCP